MKSRYQSLIDRVKVYIDSNTPLPVYMADELIQALKNAEHAAGLFEGLYDLQIGKVDPALESLYGKPTE